MGQGGDLTNYEPQAPPVSGITLEKIKDQSSVLKGAKKMHLYIKVAPDALQVVPTGLAHLHSSGVHNQSGSHLVRRIWRRRDFFA